MTSLRRVLVTGGAGFIGSCVVQQWLTETLCQIVCVDKLTYAGHRISLSSILDHPRFSLEVADIADATAVAAIFERLRPDAVLHLAAESHVDRSIAEAGAFVQSNIVGTYVLLETARRYWETLPAAARENFRFLHVSTDEVFGSLDSEGSFDEQSPYAPNSPYSASKAASDHLVRAWHRTHGLPVLTCLCSNNYGPRQFPEKLIPLTILNALAGRALPIYGDGLQVRDWLHVEDHARALWAVLERGAVGASYCIGGRAQRKNIEVVRAICRLLDELRPEGAPHARGITQVHDRLGHDHRYAMDCSKIESELGWKPQETFEGGLRRTVQWYLDHQDWVREVMRGEYPDRTAPQDRSFKP